MDTGDYERRENAIRLLKERGIWQRLTDGNHKLRYIYSGIIEIDYLELDEASGALKIVDTKHDATDLPYVAFQLFPGVSADGTVAYDDWYEEGSDEFKALATLKWQ